MKVLLIQHGEKLLVAIVLLISIFMVRGVINNSKTLPDQKEVGLDGLVLDSKIKSVQAALQQSAPTPKEPLNYTDVISNCLAVSVESADTLQWLTGHPNIVEGSTESKNLYSVYEVLKPDVEVVDEVGSVALTVKLPTHGGGRETNPKIKTGTEALWERDVGNERIVNRAYWLGVKVEFKVGDATNAKWRPLTSVGAGGVYLFKDLDNIADPSFRHTGVQGKQKYSYRASLIVAATGVREDGSGKIGEEVIVFDGEYRGSGVHGDWVRVKGLITGRLRPLSELPVKIQLGAKEKVYLGSFGDEGVIEQAESDTIMAVKQVSSLSGNPTLRLWMMKMIRNNRGEILGWTEPFELKDLKVGDKIDKGNQRVKIKGQEDIGYVMVNFSTDWTISEMRTDARRIFYYEVRRMTGVEKSDKYPDGIKLELREKARTNYHTVKINNGVETIEMIKLERLNMSERVMNYAYPLLPGNVEKFDEKEAFMTGDPLNFTQPVLVPEKPVEKPADELPPLDLLDDGKPFQTNIPYYIFPDDRVVFWDHVNKELRVLGAVEPPPKEDPEAAGGDGDEKPNGQDPDGQGPVDPRMDPQAP